MVTEDRLALQNVGLVVLADIVFAVLLIAVSMFIG